jgi:hypothetical protein
MSSLCVLGDRKAGAARSTISWRQRAVLAHTRSWAERLATPTPGASEPLLDVETDAMEAREDVLLER